MNKNEGLLSSADSIIENKLVALRGTWSDDDIEKLHSKISLYGTSLSMRRSMLMHANADDATRKSQIEFFQAMRIADKSSFNRDAAGFPAAYRNTVVDLLAMYTGLRASEVLREIRNQRQSVRAQAENEALIRHWEQTGLVPTETIVDGASTTVPNALWNNQTTKGTSVINDEAQNIDWSASETFTQRMALFAKTAELNGPALRHYLSNTLAPAHRAAEAEIDRRYSESTGKNIDNDTFRINNKSLIQHANALEGRIAFVFNKLAPQPQKMTEAAPNLAAPTGQAFVSETRKSFTQLVKAAYDVVEAGSKLVVAGIKWLTRPAAVGTATVSLAAAAAVTPAPLGESDISVTRLAHTSIQVVTPPSADGALKSFLRATTGVIIGNHEKNHVPSSVNSVGSKDVRLEIR